MEKTKFIEVLATEGLASWERTPETVAKLLKLFDSDEVVETRDTLEDFKKNCFNFKGVKKLDEITVLENFQHKKGDRRVSLYFAEAEREGVNFVYIG